MRIISLVDNDDLGLIAETEVLNISVELMETLVKLGFAKIYDDTKPIVGKGVTVWETKSYPVGRQVFYNDSIYISNCTTSGTWVVSEWDILVTGINAQ